MTLHHIPFCLVALGANQPVDGQSPAETLTQAFAEIEAAGFKIVLKSQIFSSPAYPAGSGPDYANAAASLTPPAAWDPAQVLAALHEIEAKFGRERRKRWGARTLDLDLIAMGESLLPNAEIQAAWRALSPERQQSEAPDQLILPHPRMQDRAFVLVPLAEVAPDWRHPALGKTTRELLEALPLEDRLALTPLS